MKMKNKSISVITAVTQLKWMLPAIIALALGLAAFNLTGCKTSEPATSDNAAVKYTCPMHPEVVKDALGNCPKCGMKLVEKH
jgi:hypothetical protein